MSRTDTDSAQLDWDDQGQPLSRQFGDVYFSRDNGLAETRQVFLQGNRLPERMSTFDSPTPFVIGETGFGTGLNFLCAWQLLDQCAPAKARLHFISVEKYPLNRADLTRALALWPELAAYSMELLQQYWGIHTGFQQLVFAQGRVVLTLIVGDALEGLRQLDASVHAWFLDGFSPAKNPQMWTQALFQEMARLSAPKATLGTFTSAGFVRRGLTEVGFSLKRVPGYGRKREILQGIFESLETPKPQSPTAAWFARPSSDRPESRRAIVIGAGLAGCASAASLAARGWQVTVLERHAQAAQEGSGNPQGVLYLKLSAHHTPLSQLVVSGFGYTRRLLQHMPAQQDWSDCGVLQLAFDSQEARRQHALTQVFPEHFVRVLSQDEAQDRVGVRLSAGGLWVEESGWLHPPALCRWLLQHQPNINTVFSQNAYELRRVSSQWQVWSQEGLLAEAPVVVLANATDALHFSQTAHLPLKAIRGQITRLPATPDSQALRAVVCAEGYIAPAHQGEHTLGASFALHATDLTLSEAEHGSNLALLNAISPELHQTLNAEQHNLKHLLGRAAFRCTSPDYLPLVGPVAQPSAFQEAYGRLRLDARLRPQTPCPWIEGLYVNIAHGSRGLVTAPLAAELLAAWIEHEPLPIPRTLAEACHPNRFLIRDIIRGK